MRDITAKPTTLRSAVATGRIGVTEEGADLVRNHAVDKGDVIECARVAGLLAVKQAPFVLPHCHPIPVLDTAIEVEVGDAILEVRATVRTIASTGVEMEALAAVSNALLCVYDMLKPHIGTALRIGDIHLVEKKGGKSQFVRTVCDGTAAVVVLSDSVASGSKPDTAGRSVADGLTAAGFDLIAFDVLADEPDDLVGRMGELLAADPDVIITVGGTGVGPRDRTVETVRPMLATELPGLMEAARSYGQDRTPYAMLSRGVAGLVGSTVVATFPGSRGGAEETLAAVLPGLVHLIDVLHVARPHRGGYE